MGVRHALLLNTTGSNFETLRGNDTARVKGDLSIQNLSGEVFGVDVSAATVNVAGNITGSDINISGSGTSTGSFGRVVATIFRGDGSEIRDSLTRSSGLVTASAQIASDISGAFDAGFFFGFQASSSISGGLGITGSFGRLQGIRFTGDGSGMASTLPRSVGILSSSAQIASNISGSFNKGFEFDETISGSAQSTGSFGRLETTTLVGDATNLQSTLPYSTGLVTGSAQLADRISGSFTSGFAFTTTSSLGHATGSLISAPIGAWSEVANVTTGRDYGMSAGGNGGTVDTRNSALFFGGRDYPAVCSITEEWNGTSWTEVNDMNTGRNKGGGFGSTEAAVAVGGSPGPSSNHSTNTEEYDGSEWNTGEAFPTPAGALLTTAGTLSAGMVINGGYYPGTAGYNNPGNASTENVNYDGTDWSGGDNLNLSMPRSAGGGTQNSAIVFGGLVGTNFGATCTEIYDGSSWSVAATMTHGRAEFGGDAASVNDALTAGNSYPSPGANANYGGLKTETWDGTTWTEKADSLLIMNSNNLQGKSSGGIMFGGYVRAVASPHAMVNPWPGTHVWNNDPANLTTDRVVASKFKGDGSFILPLVAEGLVTGSAQLASNISGSFTSGFTHFNQISGSATSTGSFGQVLSDDFRGDGSQLINIQAPAGVVSQSAQIASNISGSFNKGFEFTRHINDTTAGVWKTGTNMIRAAAAAGTTGACNAIFILGGGGPDNGQGATCSTKADTQNFNGITFSEGVDMINKRSHTTAFGTANSTATTGTHYQGSPAGLRLAEEFDGTSWTDTATNIIDNGLGNSVGTQNAGLAWGSSAQYNYSTSATGSAGGGGGTTRGYTTELYDGEAWSAGDNLNDFRGFGDGVAGNQSSAFSFGNETEEWNGSTWSETTEMNHPRVTMGGGTVNNAFGAGSPTGTSANKCCTEHWDGIAWTTLTATPQLHCNSTGGGMGDGLAGSIAFGVMNNTTGPQQAVGQGHEVSFWDGDIPQTNSGSFGRVDALEFYGDGSEISSSLINRTSTVLSGSKNISSRVSSSLKEGYHILNTASGSSNIGNFIGCTPSVWSIGADMSVARCRASSWGTQNSAVAVGAAHADNDQKTEEYNGTSWTAGGDTSVAHTRGYAFGTAITSGVIAGGTAGPGSTNGVSELYNGTSWSTISSPAADLTAGMYGGAGLGTVNAGLAWGSVNSGNYSAKWLQIQQFDGEAWASLSTPGLVMDKPRYGHMGSGTQNAAILISSGYASCESEIWDGISFKSVAGANVANRQEAAGGGGNSQNDAYIAGGNSFASPYAATTCTEEWDGTSWSNRNSLINARSYGSLGDLGTTRAGVVFGGCASPTVRAYTEEYTSTNTTSASFGLLEVTKLCGDGASLSDAIIASQTFYTASSEFAPYISGSFNKGFELFSIESGSANQRKSYYVGVSGSEFFNAGNATTMSISSICGSDFDYRLFDTVNQIKGTSYGTGVWSNATAMPVGVNGRGMAGTQNAFLSMGAYSDPNKTVTQKFNGNSWSLSAALNTGGRATAGVGTQNAAGLFGGYEDLDGTEFYNGAAWSEGANMGTGAGWRGSAGTQNAALLYGGNSNSPSLNVKKATTELYNGDVFTETADLNTARGIASAGGTQNDAIYASGLATPGGTGDTEIWNGTSWTEVANIIYPRWNSTGIGTANHHIVVAGQGPAQVACVEEWNGDSWSEVNGLTTARSYAGPSAGGLGSQGIYAGGNYAPAESPYTELWNAENRFTGSFGLVKPRDGKIDTKAFQVKNDSLFKLPVFSDADLNYSNYEAQYSTGSLSGSVDRTSTVTVGQNLGEMWFDSDKNAVGYTYQSSSLISQSLNFGTFANISASGNYVNCSQGLFTQSFYSHTVVTCYLTGSQI